MALSNKQREVLIEINGYPKASVNFDVWTDGKVSMWTTFNHGDDYGEIKKCLVAMREQLDRFIRDGKMCPFFKPNTVLIGGGTPSEGLAAGDGTNEIPVGNDF